MMEYKKLIEKLGKKGSVPGLLSIERLLLELGNPQENLRIVHIAGTNGKGSVFAFLSSILMEAGYKVGRYVSPTIVCYEERFQIDGRYISQKDLEYYYNKIENAIQKMKEKGYEEPTLFEAETALSFLYFFREGVDYALVETGLGGELDATNVIARPALTVFSSISYDHKAFLGNTLEEIAQKKAGIIKEDCPVILAENPAAVNEVILKRAQKRHTVVKKIRKEDYQIIKETPMENTFRWKDWIFTEKLPGRHQISNGVTALEAAALLHKIYDPKNSICGEIMQKGILKTKWPGRLEIMGTAPLFYRDGAHNPDGAKKLASFLEKHFTNKKILYIMGVLKDKEYKKMLEVLLPLADCVYVFCPKNDRGLCADTLAIEVEKCGTEAIICEDVNDAVKKALKKADSEDIMVACGSLSFMEEMKEIKK